MRTYLAEDSSDIMGGREKDSEYYLLDESDPERCKHRTAYLSRMGVATLDIGSWINVRWRDIPAQIGVGVFMGKEDDVLTVPLPF